MSFSGLFSLRQCPPVHPHCHKWQGYFLRQNNTHCVRACVCVHVCVCACACMRVPRLPYPAPADRHLGRPRAGAVVSGAPASVGLQPSLQHSDCAPFTHTPRSGVPHPEIFLVLGDRQTGFPSGRPVHSPAAGCGGSFPPGQRHSALPV